MIYWEGMAVILDCFSELVFCTGSFHANNNEKKWEMPICIDGSYVTCMFILN